MSKDNSKKQVTAKPGMEAENEIPYGMEIVLKNVAYYRNMGKRSLFVALLLAFLCVGLVATVVYLVTKPVEVLSYSMDEDGRLVQLQPLRNPTVTDTQLLNWTRDRAVDLHTFTFSGWRKQLQRLSNYFMPAAYENFISALKNTQVIKKIESSNLIVTATPRQAPVITKKGEVNGVWMWTVEMPLIQTIEGGNTAPINSTLTAQIVVQRVPRTMSLSGMRIRSYLVKEGKL